MPTSTKEWFCRCIILIISEKFDIFFKKVIPKSFEKCRMSLHFVGCPTLFSAFSIDSQMQGFRYGILILHLPILKINYISKLVGCNSISASSRMTERTYLPDCCISSQWGRICPSADTVVAIIIFIVPP